MHLSDEPLFVKPAVLPEVLAASERLPNDLFTFWRTDTAQFARVLYGMQPSREELRSVLSCLVVIELLGGGADDDEEKVDHFVRRLVDETKNLYKHERDKIEVVRQILYNVGRNDAEAELDAWIEGREYKPTVNVDIKIDKGNDEVPLTVADKDVRASLEELMQAKDDEGEYIVRDLDQWYAIFRVLSQFCGYPAKAMDFAQTMKNIGADKLRIPCKYESFRKVALNRLPQNVGLWRQYANSADQYSAKQIKTAVKLMDLLHVG